MDLTANRSHAEFSVRGELLCSLSQCPKSTGLLVREMGEKTRKHVRNAITDLQKEKVRVVTGVRHENLEGQRQCVWLEHPLDDRHLMEAETYWRLVYGG